MTQERVAGSLLIAGSLIFVLGAAIGVPRVFTEADPQERVRLLTEHLTVWRLAQPLYGLGPLVVVVGVGLLAAASPDRWTRALLIGSGIVLTLGTLAWIWSLYLRGTRAVEFAVRSLPGWPFTTYAVLTMGGLGLLGVGLLGAGTPAWLAWLTIGAAALFLIAYIRFKDIPPFVFYLLFLVVGAVVI